MQQLQSNDRLYAVSTSLCVDSSRPSFVKNHTHLNPPVLNFTKHCLLIFGFRDFKRRRRRSTSAAGSSCPATCSRCLNKSSFSHTCGRLNQLQASMQIVALSALYILCSPLAAAAASSVLLYSHTTGWTFAPAPTSALAPHTPVHLPSTTVAVLNFEHARVVIRRADVAGDDPSFHIMAATCGGSGEVGTDCLAPETAHELSAPLNSATASDVEPLLLAVAGSASPYGCSHAPLPPSPPSPPNCPPLPLSSLTTPSQVANPSIVSSSSIPDGSGGSVTLTMLRASILTGQHLQRASFALARVGAAGSSWKLLTHDFVAAEPDPLRLPVNALPMQVFLQTKNSFFSFALSRAPPPPTPPFCSVRHFACA
jgi:hypothetical protein